MNRWAALVLFLGGLVACGPRTIATSFDLSTGIAPDLLGADLFGVDLAGVDLSSPPVADMKAATPVDFANLDLLGLTGCNGLASCLYPCLGNNTCEQVCVGDATPRALMIFLTLNDCVGAACPSKNGGVCDTSSGSYSQTDCDNCLFAAQSSGGVCEQKLKDCQADKP